MIEGGRKVSIESLKIDTAQSISLYHSFFYFFLPLLVIIGCIFTLKIYFDCGYKTPVVTILLEENITTEDITTFLVWSAEPELEARKKLGIKVILFFIVLGSIVFIVKNRLWREIH